MTRDQVCKLLSELSAHYRKPKETFTSTWYSLEIAQDATTTSSIDAPPKKFDELLSSQIERLCLDVHVPASGRRARLDLRHGGSPLESYIKVYGEDEDWVNLTHGRLLKIIEGVQPQNRVVRRHYIWLWIILSLTLGWLCARAFTWYAINIAGAKGMPLTWHFLLRDLFLGFTFGMTPAGLLVEQLRKAFPSIELRLGDEHTWREAKRQRLFYALVSIAIIGPSGDLLAEVYRELFR